jgi:hypothetical protein
MSIQAVSPLSSLGAAGAAAAGVGAGAGVSAQHGRAISSNATSASKGELRKHFITVHILQQQGDQGRASGEAGSADWEGVKATTVPQAQFAGE